jgi:hypothetical protein
MGTNGNTYCVGISKVDITPPVGTYLAGFAARKEPSTGIYHPLRATAIAIDDGETPVMVIGADLLGFYERTGIIRERVGESTGLSPQQIMLCGSHTHCGPSIRELDWDRSGIRDTAYVDTLVEQVASCAEEAWQSREDCRLSFGVGMCDFAVSRRKPDGKGGVEWKPSPGSPHDHEVPVLAMRSAEGDIRGVLYSYACHPTSRGGLLTGGDYVSFAHDAIEAANPGATACFVQGCGADQKPMPVDPDADAFDLREVDQTRALGEQLGQAAAEVLKGDRGNAVTGRVGVTQTTVELETEPVDMAVVEASLESPSEYIREWARYIKEGIDVGEEFDRNVPFEVQTLRFGDSLAVVALAGEITVEHGLRLKRELRPHFGDVLAVGYANEMEGYIPVKRQIPEGGYEVWTAQQIHKRTGPFVADTEDRIHKAAHEALDVT